MIFSVAWLLVPDGLDSHTDLLELSDMIISGVYREWYEKEYIIHCGPALSVKMFVHVRGQVKLGIGRHR